MYKKVLKNLIDKNKNAVKSRQPHFILSAENPYYPEQNKLKMNHEQVLEFLKNKGYKAESIKDKYGQEEKSIIVHNPPKKSLKHLFSLSSGLGQDSSVYSDGYNHEMHYHHGDKAGKYIKGQGTDIHKEAPKDFYSQMDDGTIFTHQFDFSNEHPSETSSIFEHINDKLKKTEDDYVEPREEAHPLEAENPDLKLIHYSPTSGIKAVDPKHHGVRGIGQGAKQKPKNKLSFFYVEKTKPEDVVLSGAKSKYVTSKGKMKFYDIGKDPEGIYKRLKQGAMDKQVNPGIVDKDEYHDAIKKLGYHGIYNSKAGPQMSGAVGIFDVVPVEAEYGIHEKDKEAASAEDYHGSDLLQHISERAAGELGHHNPKFLQNLSTELLKDKEDYKGAHTAPTPDDSPLHDLTLAGTFPENIYSNKAMQYYGWHGKELDEPVIKLIHSLKGKPDATVKIYRAVPKNAEKINPGDWVAIHPQYARFHGEQRHGEGNFKILEQEVPASEVYNDGEIHEWGWHPKTQKSEILEKGAARKLYPFKPTEIDSSHAEAVGEWQNQSAGYQDYSEYSQTARDRIPKLKGNARMRMLMRLANQAKYKKNDDGSISFLLHRGVDPKEYKQAHKGTHVDHPHRSSWTTDRNMAENFAFGYKKDKPGRILSAWVNEKHLVHMPSLLGNLGYPDDGNPDWAELPLGPNYFREENEVIVDEKHASPVHKETGIPTLDERITSGQKPQEMPPGYKMNLRSRRPINKYEKQYGLLFKNESNVVRKLLDLFEEKDAPNIKKTLKSLTDSDYIDIFSRDRNDFANTRMDAIALQHIQSALLNSPLNTVQNNSKILKSFKGKDLGDIRYQSANFSKYLSKANISANHIKDLIDSVEHADYYEREALDGLFKNKNLDASHLLHIAQKDWVDVGQIIENIASHKHFNDGVLDLLLQNKDVSAGEIYPHLQQDHKTPKNLVTLFNKVKDEGYNKSAMSILSDMDEKTRKPIVYEVLGIKHGQPIHKNKASNPEENWNNWQYPENINNQLYNQLASSALIDKDQQDFIKRHGHEEARLALYTNTHTDPSHALEMRKLWSENAIDKGFDGETLQKHFQRNYEIENLEYFKNLVNEDRLLEDRTVDEATEESYSFSDWIDDNIDELADSSDIKIDSDKVFEKLNSEFDWEDEEGNSLEDIQEHPEFKERYDEVEKDLRRELIEEDPYSFVDDWYEDYMTSDSYQDAFLEQFNYAKEEKARQLAREAVTQEPLNSPVFLPAHLHSHISPAEKEAYERNKKRMIADKGHSPFLDQHIKEREYEHDYAEGLHHLEMLKDYADENKGAIDQGTMHKMHGNLSESWKKIFDGKGKLTSEEIEQKIKDLPKKKYDITFDKWTPRQSFRDKDQIVLQLNHTDDSLKDIAADPELHETFKRLQEVSKRSGHPTRDNTIAWARIDTHDPKHWFVDEIQSDFAKTARDYLKKQGEEDKAKHIEQIIKHHGDWRENILNKIIKLAKKHGVEQISTHSPETKANHVGSKKVHSVYKDSYQKAPRKLGFTSFKPEGLSFQEDIEKYTDNKRHIIDNYQSLVDQYDKGSAILAAHGKFSPKGKEYSKMFKDFGNVYKQTNKSVLNKIKEYETKHPDLFKDKFTPTEPTNIEDYKTNIKMSYDVGIPHDWVWQSTKKILESPIEERKEFPIHTLKLTKDVKKSELLKAIYLMMQEKFVHLKKYEKKYGPLLKKEERVVPDFQEPKKPKFDLPHVDPADSDLVHADYHGFGGSMHDDEQRQAVHGLDFKTAKPIKGKHLNTQGSRWVENPITKRKYIVKQSSGVGRADKRVQNALGHLDERGFNAARREVMYHNLANNFFDLGKFVPKTAGFTRRGEDYSAQEQVDAHPLDAWSYDNKKTPAYVPAPIESEYQKSLKQHHDSGDLHKLAIMDFIMGNHDRHRGNYMLGKKNNQLYLIDNGLAFDYEGHTKHSGYASGFLGDAEDDASGYAKSIHPKALEWLNSLNEDKAKEMWTKHGFEETHPAVQGFLKRLNNIKGAIKHNADKNVWDVLQIAGGAKSKVDWDAAQKTTKVKKD